MTALLAVLTTWERAALVLAFRFVLPAYETVIVCVPAAKVEVLRTAVPAAVTVAVPRTALPFLKVTTRPVGMAAVLGDAILNVAVKVITWPTSPGLADVASKIDVAADCTVSATLALVLAPKLVLAA